jgi:hypothetical protein
MLILGYFIYQDFSYQSNNPEPRRDLDSGCLGGVAFTTSLFIDDNQSISDYSSTSSSDSQMLKRGRVGARVGPSAGVSLTAILEWQS